MAHVTPGFSFAYMQECFTATLLQMARDDEDSDMTIRPFDNDNDDLDDYPIWIAFKEQADILRREIGDEKTEYSQLLEWTRGSEVSTGRHAEPAQYAREPPRRCRNRLSAAYFAGTVSLGQQLDRMRIEDELLPELPYMSQKHNYINPVSTSMIMKFRFYYSMSESAL